MKMQWEGKSFIENLPRIYGVYTGGFVLFVLAMAGLEHLGVSADTIGILFVVFTILVYTMTKGFMTPYGAIYLLSLGLAVGVTIRMRKTVEAAAQ